MPVPSRNNAQPNSKAKSSSKSSTSSSSRTGSTSNRRSSSSSNLKSKEETKTKPPSNSRSRVSSNKPSSRTDVNDVANRNSVNASKSSSLKSSVPSSKPTTRSSSKSKEDKVPSRTITKPSADPSKGSSRRSESSRRGNGTTDKAELKQKSESSNRKPTASDKDSKPSKTSSVLKSSSSSKNSSRNDGKRSSSNSRSDGKENRSKKTEDKQHKSKNDEKESRKKEESKPKKKEERIEIINDKINTNPIKIYKDEISTNSIVAEYGMKEKKLDLKKLEEENEKLERSKIEENHNKIEENNAVVNPSHNSLETVESGISLTSPNDLSDGEVEESISSRFVEVDEMEGRDDMEYSSPPSSSTNPRQSTASLSLSIDSKADKMEDAKQEAEEEEDYIDYDDDFENYESDFDDDDDDEAVSDDEEEADEDDDDESEEDDNDDDSEEDDDDDSDEEEDKDAEPDPQMKVILQAIRDENSRPSRVVARPGAPAPEIRQVRREATETGNAKPKPSRPKTSKAYVNFSRAKERAKGEKASEKIKNRGQLLQEMIQLDTIVIDLFIQISDSYESYIAAFGRTNTVQANMQTNEDALSEEIQTDPITMLDKWTQKPISISQYKESLPTPEDYLGIGGDTLNEEESEYEAYKAVSSDTGRLTKFLSAASQVMLMLLEEDSVLNESLLNAEVDENLGFSKTGIALGNGLSALLEGRKSTLVSFCSSDSALVLSGHGFKDPNNNAAAPISQENKDDAEAENDTLNSSFGDHGALLCVWSVHQPSFPQRILTCRSPPCVACFNPGRPIVVLAGLSDGSLAAWDFRESLASHPVTITLANRKWRLSPPSFITACSREGTFEGSAIVALETLDRAEEQSDNFGSFQVVSLSAMGQITWWVLIQGEIQPTKVADINNIGVSSELGAAPWSRITMSRAATMTVDDVLHSEESVAGSNVCYDLKLSGSDANQLFVSTANGSVVHCSRHNMKVHPSVFTPEIEPGTEAVSLSICPHDPMYFLVGGNDGLIRLHSVTASNPLTCWQASNNPSPVKKVEWSPSRPCVFYMLDEAGMFHVWDLSAGDIYPIISVEDGGLIGGQLINFDLANVSTDGNQSLYAVFSSESGTVGIRSISSQFLRSNEEDYRNELERFKCYVSII